MREGDDLACALGNPPVCASRRLLQFPLELEEVLEEEVAPLCGRLRPGDFQTAADGIGAMAGAEAARPAESLLFEIASLWVSAFVGLRRRAVGLTEGVTA